MTNEQITTASAKVSPPPLSWRPWIVCFTAALYFFYEYVQMNMFDAIDEQLMHDFAITAAKLGTLSSVYFLANVIFLFPAGMLLDRYSTRRIILISLSTCVLGTFLFSFSHDLSIAMSCRFLTGIGSAFCFLCCMRLASRWFPPKRLALVTGLIVTMAMIGGISAQAPLTWLSESVGWRMAIRLDSGLGLVILLAIYLVVTDYPADFATSHQSHREHMQTIGFWQSVRASVLRWRNWVAGIYTCMINLPMYLLGALWGSLYLTQIYHFTLTDAAYVVSMLFIGAIVGSPLIGALSDKLGKRRHLMLLGTVLSFLCLLPLMTNYAFSMTQLMVLFFTMGFVTSTQILSYPLVAESNPSALTASSVSVVSVSVIGGGAVFQPVFGWVMDKYWLGKEVAGVAMYNINAYHQAFKIMIVAVIIAFIMALIVKEVTAPQK